MGNWQGNAERYNARLETFGWLAVNFHSYMNAHEDGTPVVALLAPSWGGIPSECLEWLSLADLEAIRDALTTLFTEALITSRHNISMDDFLEELGWCFNPKDIEGLKMVYMTPKDPRKLPKTKGKKV